MFRGFYTVASGMIAQQRRTEMLTNNMSNVNTPGFKAEQSSIRSFPEMFMSSVQGAHVPTEKGLNMRGLMPHGPISTGVYMQETIPSFIQGQLLETELTTDVALVDGAVPVDEESGVQGTLFFVLDDGDGGEYYTRNGNFAIDGAGYLTSAEGHYVLDTDGERILLEGDDFTVTESGVIMENDAEVARLGVAFSQRPDELLKQGEGLFITEDGNDLAAANTIADTTYLIRQGYVEGSTVDAGRTMTDMLTAYRAFEANQKVLQAYDRSMEKAVTEVGRVT